MIGYLAGRVIDTQTVLVGGVGYAVQTPEPLTVGQDVTVWVHTAVRENDISLYGFTTTVERTLFSALMKVTGVGPRMALNLLTLGTGELARAILTSDAKTLARAPGIGVRKAAAILQSLTLPEELLRPLAGADAVANPLADLTDALTAMGHDPERARAALVAARDQSPDAEPGAWLRTALRALNAGLVRVPA